MGCQQSRTAQEASVQAPALLGTATADRGGKPLPSIAKDWGILGECLFKGIVGYLTSQEDFKELLAVYFSQVGVKDRSDVGQVTYNDQSNKGQGVTFHECFFALNDATNPAACNLAGSTQDLKILEIAQAVFALYVELANDDDFHYFDNVSYASKSIDAWLHGRVLGYPQHEAQWLLADVWIQKYIRSIASDKFVNWNPKRWASGLKTLWSVHKDKAGKSRSDWLSLGPFRSTNDDQMAMMIAMTKYYCNDLPSREGEGGSAVHYIGSQLMEHTTGDEKSADADACQVFVTECELGSSGPCVVEVDSSGIDLGFKLCVFRPTKGAVGEYHHVFSLFMPLLKGRNRRVIHNADMCAKGDVIGWWSSHKSCVLYRQEAGMTTRSIHFSPNDWSYVALKFPDNTTVTDKTYAVRVMENSSTWLDMKQAVFDEFPDLHERYLSLANRSHFYEKTNVTGLDSDAWFAFLQSGVITGAPKSVDDPYPVEDYSYQQLVKTKCTHVDFIKAGKPYRKCNMRNREGQCVAYAYYQQNTYELGFNVRHWLSANHEILLKDVHIDTWKNTYEREEFAKSRALRTAEMQESRREAISSFWRSVAEAGRELKYDLFLEDDNAKPWASLTLRPEEPEGSARRVTLESVDASRCFKVPSFQPANIKKDDDLQILLQAGIVACSQMGGFRGKNFLQGELSADARTVQGTLITGVDFEDPSPIAFTGRPCTKVVSARGFLGCCLVPAVDRQAEVLGGTEMSVKELYRLTPANQGELHTQVMKDITDAALALYPKKWIDALQMGSMVAGKTVPAYMTEIVKDDKVSAALQAIVTAQIAPQIWNGSTAAHWGPVGATQQEVKDRARYYMQGMDKTTLAGSPGFARVFRYVKSHHISKLTPGLSRYVAGEGGKTASQWAHALVDHVTKDMNNCYALLNADSDDGVLTKLFDIVSCLTAGSSSQADRELASNFVHSMSAGSFDFCRQIVSTMPGGVSDMKDVISRSMKELQRRSGDAQVKEDVRAAIKQAFDSLPIAQEDFGNQLAEFFHTNAKTQVYFTDRLVAWTEQMKKDFPSLATKDFNRVSNFSAYLMLSVSSTIAYYALTTDSKMSWPGYDGKDKSIKLGVGLSIRVLTSLGTQTRDQAVVPRALKVGGPLIVALDEHAFIDDGPTAPTFFRSVEDGQYYIGSGINEGIDDIALRPIYQLASETVIDGQAAAQQGFGNGCLNWVAGLDASLNFAVISGCVVLLTAVLELELMKNLDKTEKILLRVDAIVSGLSIALGLAGKAVFACTTTADVVATGLGVALGAVSWLLLAAAVVIEVVFLRIHGQDHKSPSDYVTDVGVPLLKDVNKPSKEWLRDHALPDPSEQ
eukprot:TRINITY_DN6604_c0_g1_i2.p1 TRINITY_DN6604_c0_g1~~TRINITY_DN6604_c0_g1_i2.p1  ORF type:complete len:1349 (-),score=225.13 TRINITY_DN6604_c0_g1_i2:401-4447(-)